MSACVKFVISWRCGLENCGKAWYNILKKNKNEWKRDDLPEKKGRTVKIERRTRICRIPKEKRNREKTNC